MVAAGILGALAGAFLLLKRAYPNVDWALWFMTIFVIVAIGGAVIGDLLR